MIIKARKKPIEVEAIQFRDTTKETLSFIYEWTNGKASIDMIYGNKLIIDTREDAVAAYPFDYIVKDINGEFHPVKPDIFEQTYEVIE